MATNFYYDETDPISIETFARRLIGHTFEDVDRGSILYPEISTTGGLISDVVSSQSYGNKSRKGGLGNLIEEKYFGYKANSDAKADFEKAGVELKVTPYEKNSKGQLKAGERLVLTMISYKEAVEPNFYNSHLWEKCRLLLLVYYLRNRKLVNNFEYSIDFVRLFTPPEDDLKIIEDDYRVIIDKIASGKANEISEGDTMYLGACTKGATAEKSTVPQEYYNPEVMARRRAFCYKTSYMTYILNNYLAKDISTYEPIVKNADDLKNQTFSDYIVSKINSHIGMTDVELCKLFDCDYDVKNKSLWINLAYRMLGIKSNKAYEFVKANIVVKAICLEPKGGLKESSPLPNFKFKELVAEDWEESSLYDYFTETKFLYVVFKKINGVRVLKGCQLWNMPYSLLNNDVKKEWEYAKNTISNGVVLTPKKDGSFGNNLLKMKNTKVIHIRPHSQKSFYILEDGSIHGPGTIKDADELPDGRWMTKQSFWLNSKFVYSILKDTLK